MVNQFDLCEQVLDLSMHGFRPTPAGLDLSCISLWAILEALIMIWECVNYMWLIDIILNIDGIALCKMVISNQTEQGFEAFIRLCHLIASVPQARRRLGRSATFDLSPKDSQASLCLLFLLFLFPRSQNFHSKNFFKSLFQICSLFLS